MRAPDGRGRRPATCCGARSGPGRRLRKGGEAPSQFPGQAVVATSGVHDTAERRKLLGRRRPLRRHTGPKGGATMRFSKATMTLFKAVMLAAGVGLLVASVALAEHQGVGTSAGWVPRVAVQPDPSKIMVPKGYKVEVFVDGLDTASSVAVDGQDKVCDAISGNLFAPFEYEYAGQRVKNPVSGPHVKVFDKTGKHLKDIGVGMFGFVMNEIGYCAENKKMYITEYSKHIWEIDGGDREL